MKTLTQPPIATPGQLKQLTRMAQDAVEKAIGSFPLDKEGAERVRGNAEFSARIREATIAALSELAVSDQYADEEVESSYGYLSGYTQPRPLAEQAARLRELFPDIELTYDETERPVPAGVEGNFLIPNWHAIAPTYVEAVKIVLSKLKETRNGAFYNHCEDEITPANLRETARKGEVMAMLRLKQCGHNLLVVAAQFGLRHAGRSVRRARAVIGGKGFGLGAFEIGIMLLTHPDRLQHYDDLWIDCAGDEFKPSGGSAFGCAPYLEFYDGGLEFGASEVGDACDRCGSASGFVPQSPEA